MDKLLNRIELAEDVLSQSLSKQEKIIQSLQQFSGLTLTDLPAELKKIFDAQITKLNEILSQYEIKTFEDYQKIHKKHLKDLITIMRKLCQDLRVSLRKNGGMAEVLMSTQHDAHQSCACPHH